MNKIAVIGSINIDYFIETNIFPKKGETIEAKNMQLMFGGKGANQAIAAGKLNGAVTFFGSVGDETESIRITENFNAHGVDTTYIQKVNNVNTGSAFVFSSQLDNRIILIEGANKYTNKQYLKQHLKEILAHDIFLLQFEIPFEAIEYIIPILAEHNKTIIVDPAPAKYVSPELINHVNYLLPNEHEVELLFNDQEPMEDRLIELANKLIVTNGEKGVTYSNGSNIINIPSISTEVVDTTGAGDTFAGAFSVAIAEEQTIEKSIMLGIKAASYSISKRGAQSGMPSRKDLEP